MVRAMSKRWLLVALPAVVLSGAAFAVVARGHDEPPAVETVLEPPAAPTPQVIWTSSARSRDRVSSGFPRGRASLMPCWRPAA
jgi:hypothetical protein